MILGLAEWEEKQEIMELYQKAIGSPGCTWSSDYPCEVHFDGDIRRRALFCMKNDAREIIGAISIDDDPAVDALPFWSKDLQPAAELARLVVREDYQNRGIARELIQCVLKELVLRGYQGVHYLVSKTHERALRSYAALSFELKGETDLYGEHFLGYEKKIGDFFG